MSGFLRKIRPAFISPPAEDRTVAEAVKDVDKALWLISMMPREARTRYIRDRADRLLDQRLALRPAPVVPVIPGRVEASADNYKENPW